MPHPRFLRAKLAKLGSKKSNSMLAQHTRAMAIASTLKSRAAILTTNFPSSDPRSGPGKSLFISSSAESPASPPAWLSLPSSCMSIPNFLAAPFLVSGLGGSAATLELLGFLIPPMQFLGYAASGLETILDALFELRRSPVNAPIHHGKVAAAVRVAGLFNGPLALLV